MIDFLSTVYVADLPTDRFIFFSDIELHKTLREFLKKDSIEQSNYSNTFLHPTQTQQTVDAFIFGLDELRKELGVDHCFLPILNPQSDDFDWVSFFERWGFFPVENGESPRYFVSEMHLCENGCEWIPIEHRLCPSCDYEERMIDLV